MPTILGFFTALFVVAWGTRWYLAHTNRDWRAIGERLRASLARPPAAAPAREATETPAVSRPEPERVVEGVIEKAERSSPTVTPAPAAATPPASSVEVEEVRPPRPAPSAPSAPPEIVIEATPTPPVAVEATPAPPEDHASAEATPLPTPSEPTDTPTDEVGAAWQEVAELATPAETTEAQEGEAVTEVVIGFCARCRDKRPVAQPTRTRTKKGKPAIRGQCSVCGAGMFVFTGG